MVKDITQLDDYIKLKKLASALWQQDNSYHGAAIMIGAGFSRSAATTGDRNKKLPLWFNFSELLTKELSSSSSDPLRLAEEYNAYFGKQALHDLIKRVINDSAWMPGELHKSLLELPWSEVLTTNWDTLLERASEDIHQPVYSIVSKQEDLSSARSPRIVKLHGTIDVTKDLIFTQEDYRKYPQQYAAFVNFSRQVFIENELCLLGFSGDDPNFLQWAGWVRDHLSTHSRRIYLVGVLGLSSSKRKYLESINIAPIDLYNLVDDYDDSEIRHFEATKIFIQALQDLKPKKLWEWEPTQLHRPAITEDEINRRYQDNNYAAKLLEGQLASLEKDRLSYPNWLVCPNNKRFQLQTQINDPYPNPKNLSAMDEAFKAKLLYEIAWHHKITYEVLPIWLLNELLTVCDIDKPCILTKQQQLEIALIILRNTRWMDELEESESIIQTTKIILEKGKKYWPEVSNELAYYDSILARDTFDYLLLEKCIEKITVNEPIWKLRKASLLAELGKFSEGKQLIEKAYSELLKQYRNNHDSIYLLSHLAWAHWLVHGINLGELKEKIRIFSFDFKEMQCDPWDYIECLQGKITKSLEKQREQEIEPLFEPGRYKDKSNTITFSNELHPLLLLEGISNTVGMPLRWEYTNFLVDQATKIAELENIDNIHSFSLAIRAANSDTSNILKKVFSRIGIACLDPKDVDFLISKTMSSIEYWCSKRDAQSEDVSRYAIDRLRVFIEVLARVSVRATSDQAKQIFRLAASLGKNTKLHHLWLFDAIKDLIKFSLESIPKSEQHEVLLDALCFPLQKEVQAKDFKWGNPIIKKPGERKPNTSLDRRIDEIIDNIFFNSSESAPALLRLLPLIKHQFLTDAECQKIALKIWGESPDYRVIPKTGLLNYVLLELPNHNHPEVQNLIRKYLFESKDDDLFNRQFLMDVANAAQADNIKELPTEEQAVYLFEKLVSWKREINENDIFGDSKLISQVLSRSVVPSLPKEALNKENFQKLCELYVENDAPEILMAFPYFAVSNEIFVERVENIIKKSFQSIDANRLAYVSYAILAWRDLQDSDAVNRLIKRFIYYIASNRMQGLAALLWTANQMYKKEYLSSEDIESLIEILPIIFDSTDYQRIDSYSKESVSISFARAACVRLARDILNNAAEKNTELERILEVAKQDPLPEVRFAEATDV